VVRPSTAMMASAGRTPAASAGPPGEGATTTIWSALSLSPQYQSRKNHARHVIG